MFPHYTSSLFDAQHLALCNSSFLSCNFLLRLSLFNPTENDLSLGQAGQIAPSQDRRAYDGAFDPFVDAAAAADARAERTGRQPEHRDSGSSDNDGIIGPAADKGNDFWDSLLWRDVARNRRRLGGAHDLSLRAQMRVHQA